MESIKNKMESLVSEKEKSTSIAETLEADVKTAKNNSIDFEKRSTDLERLISNLEGEFDHCQTATADGNEKLEVATKVAGDAELEVSALLRRLQLLDDESAQVNKRLDEVLNKLPAVEKNLEDNERIRKVLEATSFQNEEKGELNEVQLQEATVIAEEADRKCEEYTRKLRMVDNDLERIVDRAEEFERKSLEAENNLASNNKKLKELEDLSQKNGVKEDGFEESMRQLTFDLNNAEQRAEFAERTVDKLESSIDHLTDQLYQEKCNYRDLSVKLDTTLNDMMGL